MSTTHTKFSAQHSNGSQLPKLWRIPDTLPLTNDFFTKVSALQARLESVVKKFSNVRLASSLGPEDMVLTDAILRGSAGSRIRIFTLDTGRLHPETLAILEKIAHHYGTDAETEVLIYTPVAESVEAYAQHHGLHAMYDSVELRKQCCQLRKTEPLTRALAGADAWMTGQRREQASTRIELPFEEKDHERGLTKFNPLVDWLEQDVWTYLQHYQVPFNVLHQKGYPSIGCEPCTRAVLEGEDMRAGRWWWESQGSKECGLHEQNIRTQKIYQKEVEA